MPFSQSLSPRNSFPVASRVLKLFQRVPSYPRLHLACDVAKAHTLTHEHTHARTLTHTTHTHPPVGALLVQANGEIRALESVRQEREEREERDERATKPRDEGRGTGRGRNEVRQHAALGAKIFLLLAHWLTSHRFLHRTHRAFQ